MEGHRYNNLLRAGYIAVNNIGKEQTLRGYDMT